MKLSDVLILRYICRFVIWLSCQDEFLDVHPPKVFVSESLPVFFLSLGELQEEHTDEEVQEEEAINENE